MAQATSTQEMYKDICPTCYKQKLPLQVLKKKKFFHLKKLYFIPNNSKNAPYNLRLETFHQLPSFHLWMSMVAFSFWFCNWFAIINKWSRIHMYQEMNMHKMKSLYIFLLIPYISIAWESLGTKETNNKQELNIASILSSNKRNTCIQL